MGFHFYDSPGPEPGAVVWCRWPHRAGGLAPGPHVRPVLVLGRKRFIHQPTATEYDDLIIQYGTGSFEDVDLTANLCIGKAECKALGLHKPTLFKIDVGNRRRLPWCTEYFVPQEYVRDQNVVAGSLNPGQWLRLRSCFDQRGLTFPVPWP